MNENRTAESPTIAPPETEAANDGKDNFPLPAVNFGGGEVIADSTFGSKPRLPSDTKIGSGQVAIDDSVHGSNYDQ